MAKSNFCSRGGRCGPSRTNSGLGRKKCYEIQLLLARQLNSGRVRRGRESNPRIEVLQTSALPLGYPAGERISSIALNSPVSTCKKRSSRSSRIESRSCDPTVRMPTVEDTQGARLQSNRLSASRVKPVIGGTPRVTDYFANGMFGRTVHSPTEHLLAPGFRLRDSILELLQLLELLFFALFAPFCGYSGFPISITSETRFPFVSTFTKPGDQPFLRAFHTSGKSRFISSTS